MYSGADASHTSQRLLSMRGLNEHVAHVLYRHAGQTRTAAFEDALERLLTEDLRPSTLQLTCDITDASLVLCERALFVRGARGDTWRSLDPIISTNYHLFAVARSNGRVSPSQPRESQVQEQ